MRSAPFVPASLLAAALAFPLASAASANVAITIDKTNQQMTVSVDGAQRYTWPVSTGRPGYDTPNGAFKPNRMDADHFSQEWDNAPMPHAIFFDMHGHAIHGFFDVKHLGLAVSHGCVRLSPEHATTLFDLVKTQGMANTSVTVTGRTPGGDNGPVARSHLPANETVYAARPQQTAPRYGAQSADDGYDQAPSDYYRSRSGFPPQPPPVYGQQPPPVYGQQAQGYYDRPAYGQGYYAPSYGGQSYYYRQQPYYGQPYYGQ